MNDKRVSSPGFSTRLQEWLKGLVKKGPSHSPLRLEQLRIFYIGGYWRGPNDMVRQMLLALLNTGATVYEYNTDEHPEALDNEGRPYLRGVNGPVWLRWEFLEEKIRDFRPDLIICNAGGLSFRPDVALRLRKEIPLLGIALSDPNVFEPTTRHTATNFDFFVTNIPECVPRYLKLGARAAVLPIATNEEFFRPIAPRPEYECEVVMIGNSYADRIEPVRAIYERFDTHIYGENWDQYGLPTRGLIFAEDLMSALNSAKMTMIFLYTPSGAAVVKVGLFDFLAAGALVLTNYFEPVEHYLTYGKEIVGFGSTQELLEKIQYYLDHPAEAQAIREAGRARVLREHTWKQVWPRIIEQVMAVRSSIR